MFSLFMYGMHVTMERSGSCKANHLPWCGQGHRGCGQCHRLSLQIRLETAQTRPYYICPAVPPPVLAPSAPVMHLQRIFMATLRGLKLSCTWIKHLLHRAVLRCAAPKWMLGIYLSSSPQMRSLEPGCQAGPQPQQLLPYPLCQSCP